MPSYRCTVCNCTWSQPELPKEFHFPNFCPNCFSNSDSDSGSIEDLKKYETGKHIPDSEVNKCD